MSYMSHIIVNKLYYQNEQDLLTRIKIYKKITLPSLLEQTNQNFDIGVLCNPKHEDIIREIHPRIIPFFSDVPTSFRFIDGVKFYIHFLKWGDIYGIEKYDIQTCVSSDDYVKPEFTQKIEDVIREEDDGKSTHIYFEPRLMKLITGETKDMLMKYREGFTSGFYSIYQPNKDPYIYVGQECHTKIGNLFEKSIMVKGDYCYIGIHDTNDSSHWNL